MGKKKSGGIYQKMSILSAIVLLGVIIFVHELGHFLFAKLLKVKVLKFSLGFGPKIIGKKYGDTEYLISSIPLGGYVKMVGETSDTELTEEEKPFAFNLQPSLEKICYNFLRTVIQHTVCGTDFFLQFPPRPPYIGP